MRSANSLDLSNTQHFIAGLPQSHYHDQSAANRRFEICHVHGLECSTLSTLLQIFAYYLQLLTWLFKVEVDTVAAK